MSIVFCIVACCSLGMAALDLASGKSPADTLQLAFLTLIAAKIWGREDA